MKCVGVTRYLCIGVCTIAENLRFARCYLVVCVWTDSVGKDPTGEGSNYGW